MSSDDTMAESAALRPRDLALLLLASGDLRPRKRARDQQADTAGLALKRWLLEELAGRDPEPAELEAALEALIQDRGPPHGPTRALAGSVRDDWQSACRSPEWLQELLRAATQAREGEAP